METNSFTFEVAHTNIESKIKINSLLFDPLTPICVHQWCQLSKLLYSTAADVIANLINADKRIKGIQIGDRETKIVNFTDNITIFLRDITWGTFKKYISSRFPSFKPHPPKLAIVIPPSLPLFVFDLPTPPRYIRYG